MTCLGKVESVRRRWVVNVTRSGPVGHWIHQAHVRMHGKLRTYAITKAVFDDLIAKGTRRQRDANRFPGSAAQPPTKCAYA